MGGSARPVRLSLCLRDREHQKNLHRTTCIATARGHFTPPANGVAFKSAIGALKPTPQETEDAVYDDRFPCRDDSSWRDAEAAPRC
jgi:hypothetical protein